MHDRSVGKWGGSLGVFGQFPLVENDIYDSAWLYFQPQLEYSMLGETAKVNTPKYGKQEFYHDYITFQAYIKYFFHKGNMKRDVFLFAGPKVEFLVREDRKVSAAYDLTHAHINRDDKVEGFGFGASVGAGLKISDRMEGYFRYDRGFSKVYPNNSRNTVNQMIAVGVNYYLSETW